MPEGAEQNFTVEFLGFNEWGERILSSVGEDRMRIDFQEDCWVEIDPRMRGFSMRI